MALIPVRKGEIAAVVTYLEMTKAPPPAAAPERSALKLVHWARPDIDEYRALFRAVGTPWLWFSRLVMPDAALSALLEDPLIEVRMVTNRAGARLGLLELDFRRSGECEIAYFGLVPAMTGKGHGHWLMRRALDLGWREGIDRLWLHSCTLDHPAALDFYQRHGFVPYARAVECFADPRLLGLVDRDAAPHLPLID